LSSGCEGMARYVALIHKEADGCYGVSFPDLPGVITGGDTIDEAMEEAAEVLQFAAEDWTNPDGSTGFKPPSTIDELQTNPEFLEDAKDAVVAFVEFPPRADAAE
jgi:antitoxin HicB